MLLAAVFGTAIDPRAPKLGGLAIGLAVAADILMGGPLTGAAMNPARWFGPAAVTGRGTTGSCGSSARSSEPAIAALAYRYLFRPEASLTQDAGRADRLASAWLAASGRAGRASSGSPGACRCTAPDLVQLLARQIKLVRDLAQLGVSSVGDRAVGGGDREARLDRRAALLAG